MTVKDHLVLIVGAMKAGTTTLFDHLAEHPQVCGCYPKEPGFFAFDDVFAHGSDWYEGLFAFDIAHHKVALDGSTDYAKWPHCDGVLDRVSNFGANPKLIYLMRHPLRRIESHAKHVQFARRELGMRVSPRDDHSLDFGVSDVSLDISRYGQQLDRYQEKIAKGDMLLLTLEEMSANPKATLIKVCEFLDLDSKALKEDFEARNKGATVRRGHEIHPLWDAAKKVKPFYAAVKSLIPQKSRDALRARTKPKVTIEGRFKLTANEEADLLKQLTPDLIRLRDHYGVDIERIWDLSLDEGSTLKKAMA